MLTTSNNMQRRSSTVREVVRLKLGFKRTLLHVRLKPKNPTSPDYTRLLPIIRKYYDNFY